MALKKNMIVYILELDYLKHGQVLVELTKSALLFEFRGQVLHYESKFPVGPSKHLNYLVLYFFKMKTKTKLTLSIYNYIFHRLCLFLKLIFFLGKIILKKLTIIIT
jgi:hypothetical protein